MDRKKIQDKIKKLKEELENANSPRDTQILHEIRELEKKLKKSRVSKLNNLALFFNFVMLTACGGGDGGAAGGSGHVPDTTPHTYSAVFYALTNTNQAHPATIHQVCDFGYADARDESATYSLQDPNINGGMGCADASNYTLEASNTGADILYLDFRIDNVQQYPGGLVVQPGTTFTYSAGF